MVGLATALQLQRPDCEVTLVDRLAPGEGTSSGNAGIFATSAVHPEAMPGFWRDIPALLLDRDAPVRLRPRHALRFAPWLLRFLAQTRPQAAERASRAISTLSARGLAHWDRLIAASGAEHLIRRRGLLYVYETPGQFDGALDDDRYRDRRGVAREVIRGDALRDLEPDLAPGLAGGILAPGAAHTTSPLALSRALHAQFLQQGGRFLQQTVTDFEFTGDRVSGVRTLGEAHPGLPADAVFVTAGAWSAELAARLGSPVPLESERGYHLRMPDPGVALQRAVLFPGRGFAATPMADGLRLAGTVEFAGLEAPPDHARARLMLRHARQLLPSLRGDGIDPWMGHRPSVPDSVPVIGRSPHHPNAYFGFGHGHLGLTQAAITGAMLSALADGRPPPVPLAPHAIDRRW